MELSEEEKNFLENIKNILSDLEDTEDGAIISLNQEEIDSLKSIPKLIENKQNKIATLKKQIKLMQKDDRISKEKIREEIKCCKQELEHIKKGEEFEDEKDFYEYKLLILKPLLEEN